MGSYPFAYCSRMVYGIYMNSITNFQLRLTLANGDTCFRSCGSRIEDAERMAEIALGSFTAADDGSRSLTWLARNASEVIEVTIERVTHTWADASHTGKAVTTTEAIAA